MDQVGILKSSIAPYTLKMEISSVDLKKKHVIIIGAGVGGVALAARLAHAGLRVSVYEKNNFAGGRLSIIEKNGFRFDQGPSLFLMPDIFKETFKDLQTSLSDQLELVRCDPNYRIYFEDGQTMELHSNQEKMLQLVRQWDPDASFLEFQKESKSHYDLSVSHVLTVLFENWTKMFNLKNLKLLPKLNLHISLYQFASKYFKHPKLRQAFTFQAMYMGMSPFDAPATYSLLQYTEYAEGIWYPLGGFHKLVSSLQSIAETKGTKFYFNKPVTRICIDNDKATGIQLEDGSQVKADLVVCNADLVWSYNHLLPPSSYAHKLTQKDHTSSSVSFYWGFSCSLPLRAHNVFLADAYQSSFDTIFKEHGLPESLSFYIHVPSKLDPQAAPKGKEAVTVLVPCGFKHNAPNLDAIAQQIKKSILASLEWHLGLSDLESFIETEIINTPATWAEKFNLYDGSILGLSHSIFQVCYFRPSTQHSQYKNIYFVGASTHPGTGVPICLYGAKLVSQQILSNLSSNVSSYTSIFKSSGAFLFKSRGFYLDLGLTVVIIALFSLIAHFFVN